MSEEKLGMVVQACKPRALEAEATLGYIVSLGYI
jgi:hypothetical protein